VPLSVWSSHLEVEKELHSSLLHLVEPRSAGLQLQYEPLGRHCCVVVSDAPGWARIDVNQNGIFMVE
jgi:hypothetical protein